MFTKLLNNRGLRLIIIIIGTYSCIQIAQNIFRLWSVKLRIDQSLQHLVQLQKENQVLNQQLSSVQNPVFVEKEARNKLGLAKDGEVILVLPQDEVKKLAEALKNAYLKPEDKPQDLQNWQKWVKLFTE